MNDFTLHERLEADSIFIRDLTLSQLRLNNVKSVPWLILVPKRAEIKEIYELAAPDRTMLMEEMVWASKLLINLYAPDKINVAALGNQVPQLHMHVIARFTKDEAWPGPVWGKVATEPYDLMAIKEIKAKLKSVVY